MEQDQAGQIDEQNQDADDNKDLNNMICELTIEISLSVFLLLPVCLSLSLSQSGQIGV